MNQKPFFNANFIIINSAGEYYGVRSTIRLMAFREFIQFGTETITYDRLIKIQANEDKLYAQFIDSKGKLIEGYLKYNPFLPFTATKKLRELVKNIKPLIPKNSSNSIVPITASVKHNKQNRAEVIVHSSKVSFPPFCPACFNPATKISKFEVLSVVPASDFLKIGFWLIPVCNLHKNLTNHIKVKNWSPGCSEIAFDFTNRLYSDAFLKINQSPQTARNYNDIQTLAKIKNLRNFKFIVYEYYISALIVGFLQISDVQELKANESRFIRGLKFNAVTMFTGWWSFPLGPFYTIIVLLKNFAGGIDLTEKVIAVYKGTAFSALED